MNYKVFIGIDQSKSSFDATMLLYEDPANAQHKQFENNKKGLAAMVKWMDSFGKFSADEILFCSEHTGIYSLRLSIFLNERRLHLWLENPLQIKRSSGMVRGKNDKADSRMIAEYAFMHHHKARLYRLPSDALLRLKDLLSYRESLIKHQSQLKSRRTGAKEFTPKISAPVIKSCEKIIRTLEKEIEAVNVQMLAIVNENSELLEKFNLVKSVHGVGKQTALTILVYTNAFTLFDDPRKFSCYCGIAPFEYSSGSSIRGKTRVSHFANKKLKSLLTMCALNTIKKENEFKIYYDRRIKEGKSAMSTINVLRNKIVSRIFAAIKRGTPYVPNLSVTV